MHEKTARINFPRGFILFTDKFLDKLVSVFHEYPGLFRRHLVVRVDHFLSFNVAFINDERNGIGTVRHGGNGRWVIGSYKHGERLARLR